MMDQDEAATSAGDGGEETERKQEKLGLLGARVRARLAVRVIVPSKRIGKNK